MNQENQTFTEEQVKNVVGTTRRGEAVYNTSTVYNIEINVGNNIHRISYPKTEIIKIQKGDLRAKLAFQAVDSVKAKTVLDNAKAAKRKLQYQIEH